MCTTLHKRCCYHSLSLTRFSLLLFAQHYFSADDFPSNMPKLWEKRFAFLAKSDTAPVVIGEMGGFYR